MGRQESNLPVSWYELWQLQAAHAPLGSLPLLFLDVGKKIGGHKLILFLFKQPVKRKIEFPVKTQCFQSLLSLPVTMVQCYTASVPAFACENLHRWTAMLLLRDPFLTQTGKDSSTGVTFIALCFSRGGGGGCGHDANAYCFMISAAGQSASFPWKKIIQICLIKMLSSKMDRGCCPDDFVASL